MRPRDHQSEIRDMPACRMLIASDREPPHDRSVLTLRDEHSRVRITPDRAQVTALVADAPPPVLRREPPLRLRRDRVAELLQRLRISGISWADDERHRTITPAPPRRGSPAAARVPSSRISTAAAPPKYRLRRRQRTSCQPIASSLRNSAGSWPPSQLSASPSRCTRGRLIASRTPSPCCTTFTITCITAPRSRNDPALPTTSRGRPSRRTSDGLIPDDNLAPGRGRRGSENSPSMLFRWIPVPG